MTAVAELARTRTTLIPRWFGHGDLTIVVDDERAYLRADQVEQLAGIPPWSTGETLLGDAFPLEMDGRPFYELDEAIARCETAQTTTAGEFLAWLGDTLADLLEDEVLDVAQPVPAFIGSHPVAAAARLLSDDPEVRIGRQGLFAHMHALGWTERHDDHWVMTNLPRRRGWLTTRNVALGPHRGIYPQIHVTPAGLAELGRTLHAVNPERDSTTTPHPTLFE